MGLRRVCLYLCFALFILTGCTAPITTTSTTSSSASSFIIDPSTVVPETSYSAATTTYSGSTVTINSTVQYQRFDDSDNAGNPLTLTTKSLNPIRHAEVVIYDSAGNVIQTGKTDSSGQIQNTQETVTGLIIPKPSVNTTYKLQINSRAYNSKIRVSVLNDPQANAYYSISANFTVTPVDTTVSVTVNPATASYDTATGKTLEGGAFNILDQIYVANEYLRNNSGNSSIVVNKLQVFWKPGFDPGSGYLGTSSTVSYFLSSPYSGLAKGLYIVGGSNGSVCGDTDHFDRSIILHEYGHYLENQYAGSDSPGGTHYGTNLVDPRLAWSEGWANFFNGAAISRPYYWDTSGNSECSGGSSSAIAMIRYSIRSQSTGGEPLYPTISVTDTPNSNVAGEGVFREFSISRTLFKTITGSSTNPDGFYANVTFASVWTAFTGMLSTGKFRNAGLMLKNLQTTVTANENAKLTNYNNLVSSEKQSSDQSWYATPLATYSNGTSGCIGMNSNTFTRSTASDNPTSSALASSLRRSNHYFTYVYDGNAANAIIKVKYRKKPTDAFTNPFDLTAYAYSYTHDFNLTTPEGQLIASSGSYPENSSDVNYPGLETINLTGQGAGTYMLRVQVSGTLTSRAETQFIFENASTGDWLCPNP